MNVKDSLLFISKDYNGIQLFDAYELAVGIY